MNLGREALRRGRADVAGGGGHDCDFARDNVISFLVSNEEEFVVGQNYVSDGGWSVGLRGRH